MGCLLNGGSLREGWLAVGPDRRLADDGKRLCGGRCNRFLLKGGSLGEGMARTWTGREAGG